MYLLLAGVVLALVAALGAVAWRVPRSAELTERIATVVVVVVLATGAVAVAHKVHYREWPFGEVPSTFSWCGRTFTNSEPTSVRPSGRLYHTFTYAPLLAAHHEVFSEFSLDASDRSPPSGSCFFVLWMRVGSGYELYGPEGGP